MEHDHDHPHPHDHPHGEHEESGDVHADVVNISQGGANTVHAESVTVSAGDEVGGYLPR